MKFIIPLLAFALLLSGQARATQLIGDTIRSSDRTHVLTLPTVTDTLCAIAASQTFTNKTLDCGSNTCTIPTSALSGTVGAAHMLGLTSGHIYVGNASNQPADVAMSGAITQDATGANVYNQTVPLNKGGTGNTTKASAFDSLQPMSSSGDLIYGGTSGTGTRLAKGSDTQVLTLAGGLPTWASPSSSGPRSEVWLTTANGYGDSGHLATLRFTTQTLNTGSDITYADSSHGGTLTINTAGVYSVTVSGSFSSQSWIGVGYNANQNTDVEVLSTSTRLCLAGAGSGANAGSCSATFIGAVNDVITAAGAETGTGTSSFFTLILTKVSN